VSGMSVFKWSTAAFVFVACIQGALAHDHYSPQHWRHHRIAYVEPGPGYSYIACREGWWQSLRYGHVQPIWGVRCH
jgi:hypothetical protein